jgi:hypothetical protein
MTQTPHPNESPEIIFHLRWVARITVLVGALAAAGLVFTLVFVTDTNGQSYGALIESRSIAHDRLGTALLLGGLVLSAFAAAITWLITLYSSFRIAGPLFRLSRNLENSIRRGPCHPIPIRASDRLHDEAQLLEDSLAVLSAHYSAMRQDIDQALEQIDGADISPEKRQAIVERLQTRIDHARI